LSRMMPKKSIPG